MTNEDNKSEIIEALFLVISEFDENPIEDTDVNEVMIEIMSRRIEQLMD